MAGYICCGSRIADKDRSWQAAEDVNVTDWTKANSVILAMQVYTTAHSPPTETLKFQWRKTGGTFADVSSSGACKHASDTVLVDTGTLSTGNYGCTNSWAQYDSGHELEGSNSVSVTASAKQYGVELQIALSFADADAGDTFEFQLYDTTTADAVGYGDGTSACVTIQMTKPPYDYRVFKPPVGTKLNKGHILSQNLAGCWLFNERFSLDLYDHSESQAHASSFAGSMTESDWVDTPHGPALDFDGSDDVITCAFRPGSPADNVDGSQMTVALWLYPDDSANGLRWAFACSSELVIRRTTDPVWEFILNSFSANDRVTSSAGTAVDQTWVFVVGRYDGTNLELFINGQPDASVTPTGAWGGAGWGTSYTFSSAGALWKGKIASAMIWSRALSNTEISLLYFDPYIMFRPHEFALSPAAPAGQNVPEKMHSYRQRRMF